MDATMKRVAVAGSELAYTERGEGEALVLVHGSLGDLRDWSGQVDAFAERYRVIALSRRYHWPNARPTPADRYVIARQVDDVAAFIDALGIAPARLVGASYGALTALTLAATRPGLARALVLGEPPLFPWLRDTADGSALFDAFLAGAWEPAGEAARRGDSEAMVRCFLDGVAGEGTFDRIPPPARTAVLENAPAMLSEVQTPPGELYPTLSREDVSRIGVPVLLLDGEVSPLMFGAVQNLLASCLADVERVTIPSASHAMHVANPDAYKDAVLPFLARH